MNFNLSEINLLTEVKNLAYSLCMKGKVRTREKCPNCKSKYKIIEEIDIFCPNCNTRPKTFFIVFYWDGVKHRISRDIDGHILDSYKRAHRLLENIRKDIDDKIFSLSDYLPKEIEAFRGYQQLKRWLQFKESSNLAPTHMREVKRYIEAYYMPFFKKFDVRQIRTHHIEDFFMRLPKHLSDKTKKNIMTMLKNFCHWLLSQEVLLRMPQFPVISPPEPTIEWINKEDQLRILKHLHPHHTPIFEFMAYHPVRPGEARALKVKDINIVNRSVHVCRAFSLKELRSRKNKKPYHLPLSQHFDLSILKNKLPEAYVFTNKAGRPYTSEGLRRLWHKAREKAGVPHIKLYNATRHSIASQATNDGVPLEIVSAALGHSSNEMTKKYASLNIQRLRVIVDGRAQIGQIESFIKDKLSNNKGKFAKD